MFYEGSLKIMRGLRDIRLKRGLTQAELAEKFGVETNTVWRWEAGNSYPNIEMLKNLAEFFGVSESELLNGERQNEIEIRILIRESDDEVGNITMDMSKDAPFLQLMEISPHKTGVNVIFGQN